MVLDQRGFSLKWHTGVTHGPGRGLIQSRLLSSGILSQFQRRKMPQDGSGAELCSCPGSLWGSGGGVGTDDVQAQRAAPQICCWTCSLVPSGGHSFLICSWAGRKESRAGKTAFSPGLLPHLLSPNWKNLLEVALSGTSPGLVVREAAGGLVKYQDTWI